MLNDGMMTSNNQEWRTPQYLFDDLNREFKFEYDLFASNDNNLCKKYYTKKNSAFNKVWRGVSFANPPYDTKIQNRAFEKADLNASLFGATIVMLVPARTDTKRFHDFVFDQGYEVRFLRGRLKFSDSKNSAPFPSCIIIFKKEVKNNVCK